MTNQQILDHLREQAHELERQGGHLFRSRAYRSALFALSRLDQPLEDLFRREGRKGLEALPGIGRHLAYTLEGLLTLGQPRRLRNPAEDPRDDLLSLPGVGPRLAERLRDELGLRSLEQLLLAIRAGKLSALGLSPRLVSGLLLTVEARLAQRVQPISPAQEPSVVDLLEVDAAFRAQSAPVLATQRQGWRLRAAFANHALAHRLGRTTDWVCLSFENDASQGQRTAVTETRGDLRGQRVIRGREGECRCLSPFPPCPRVA